MAKSYKGLYRPTNPKKYVGDPNRIVYRSLLERRFMLYCDRTPEIIAWASEEIAIKYYNPLDKRVHRYFPDFIVKTSKDKKYIIEIKPYKQTLKPKVPSKKTKSFLRESFEYIKNISKWQAAKVYAEEKGYEFKIMTEKELGIYN
tara:strand:- start:207 stop:641 length:435 start_codon:yes stop_codon:yes gene_type:complete